MNKRTSATFKSIVELEYNGKEVREVGIIESKGKLGCIVWKLVK